MVSGSTIGWNKLSQYGNASTNKNDAVKQIKYRVRYQSLNIGGDGI